MWYQAPWYHVHMSDKQAGWLSFLLALLAGYGVVHHDVQCRHKWLQASSDDDVNDGGNMLALREFLLNIYRLTAILPQV